MNYILFNEYKNNYYLKLICENECNILLNNYLHAYVDKSKEDIEKDGITFSGLPSVLPDYVVTALKVRLKKITIDYINNIYEENNNLSIVHTLLLSKLRTQSKNVKDKSVTIASANYDFLKIKSNICELDLDTVINDINNKSIEYEKLLYELFTIENYLMFRIENCITIADFFVIFNEIKNNKIALPFNNFELNNNS